MTQGDRVIFKYATEEDAFDMARLYMHETLRSFGCQRTVYCDPQYAPAFAPGYRKDDLTQTSSDLSLVEALASTEAPTMARLIDQADKANQKIRLFIEDNQVIGYALPSKRNWGSDKSSCCAQNEATLQKIKQAVQRLGI